MARVHLITTNSAAIAGDWWTSFSRLKQSSSACRSPIHHLVANPEDADIILFSDSLSNSQADVRAHPLMRRFGERVFVYSTSDADVPFVPGVYTSTELRWYLPSHVRSGFYIKVIDHDWIQPSQIKEKPLYLFSFCGSIDTHPFRKQIAKLEGTNKFIRDTSNDEGRGFGRNADIYRRWQDEYFQVMHDSLFVLCPRGKAPSSYRIFEAMKAGRVPVIIADEWVPPTGPSWAQFSLRVPEANLENVPQILEQLADRGPEMGLRASEAWKRWFSREQAFQTVVSLCLQIQEARQNLGSFQHYRPLLQLARPHFFRHVVLRAAKSRLLGR